MEGIKCIHEIRNGWLVVVREGEKYIKIDDILVGESGGYSDVEEYGGGLKLIDEEFEYCEDFDIVEIWKPKYKAASLSFDLDDRKIVWKEQEQKYYIKHRWSETEFTLLEIEELKEKYNTTLEDFEIIPVEEI